jgi:hypothetical protein
MHPYDAARFDSPAPLALVIVKAEPSSAIIRDIPMLIDKGLLLRRA